MTCKMMGRFARTLSVTAIFIIELLITPNYADTCPDGRYSTNLQNRSTYFYCSNHIWNLMTCPAGLIFNINKSQCDYPNNFNFNAGNNPSLDSIQTTTSSTISKDWTTLSATSPSSELATQSSSMGSKTTTTFTTSSSTFTLTSTSDTTTSATNASAWISPTSPSPVTFSTTSSMLYSDVTFSQSSSFSQVLDNTSSTSTTTSLLSSTMKPSYMRTCVCYFRAPSNQTLKERIEDIEKTLKVEKKSLSSRVHKMTSAHDRRPSGAVIGYTGIGLLLVVPAVIILMDLQRLFLYISSRR